MASIFDRGNGAGVRARKDVSKLGKSSSHKYWGKNYNTKKLPLDPQKQQKTPKNPHFNTKKRSKNTTFHTSYITLHTSELTFRTSKLTLHTSHLTYYILYYIIIQYNSYVGCVIYYIGWYNIIQSVSIYQDMNDFWQGIIIYFTSNLLSH